MGSTPSAPRPPLSGRSLWSPLDCCKPEAPLPAWPQGRFLTSGILSRQNLMTTLPSQDASLPPQQPYIAGQQPMYQQVSHARGLTAAPTGQPPPSWFSMGPLAPVGIVLCACSHGETHTQGPFSADRTRTQVLGQTCMSTSVDRKTVNLLESQRPCKLHSVDMD